MVYKKYKDFKLEVIQMMFEKKTTSEIISFIESLEENKHVTPSQIQYLVDMVCNAEKYILTGSDTLHYITQILVYKRKIIASYIPERGVYLE